MEENVALDSRKQKKFVKSIQGIKKLIKKNEEPNEAQVKQPLEPAVRKKDATRIKKRKIQRGLVYLSHIPHGFYEHQMTQYFKQFGMVTNVRVIRSKRTGRSKGFAFVEFKEPSVAEIVAETMNNYLMGKRLIKAVYIPPENQRRAMRKHWNTVNNPGNNLRMKIKKNFNAVKDEQGEMKRAKKLLSNLNKTKKRLKEMGIDYDFFMPVDIPEMLLKNMVKTEKYDDDINQLKHEKAKLKKTKKTRTEEIKAETKEQENKGKASNLVKVEVNKKVNMKSKKLKEKQKVIEKQKKVPEINKKQQKQKESQLTDSGIKYMGDFVKVGDNSDSESDSSLGFDSDEYEKMMGSDDGFDSEDDQSDNSEADEETDGDSEGEDEESPTPVKKVKQKIVENKQETKKKVQETRSQRKQKDKKPNQQEPRKMNKTRMTTLQLNSAIKDQHSNKQDEAKKRKIVQKTADSPKKPKFEKKNNQKQMKKGNKAKK